MKTGLKDTDEVNGRRQRIAEMQMINNSLQAMTNGLVQSRLALIKSNLDPVNRDLNADCGYPANPQVHDYHEMYKTNGIARRIVWAFPSECWRQIPEIYETEAQRKTRFERRWDRLATKHSFYHYLRRIDGISGIGYYGALLFGLPGKLSTAVPGVGPDGEPNGRAKPNTKLLYLRAFSHNAITILKYEQDRSNPRYGQPLMYGVKFDQIMDGEVEPGPAAEPTPIHWTRILHVADNCESSEVFGRPRQEIAGYHRLLDIRKILGGSAEMFWKGAFPGYSFEMDPQVAIAGGTIDKEKLKEEIFAFQNNLQRYLAVLGLNVKSLAPQVADPSKHFDTQLEAICIAIEVPKRIFLGSEIGQLASEQDKKNWNERLLDRQNNYLTPRLVRPFVSRLISVGVLPEVEDFKVAWPDLNAPSGKEIAEVAEKQVNALYKWLVAGGYNAIPLKEYLTHIAKMDLSEVLAIVEAAMKSLEDPEEAENAPAVVDQRQQELQAEQQQDTMDHDDERDDVKFQQQKELLRQKNIGANKNKPKPKKGPKRDKRA